MFPNFWIKTPGEKAIETHLEEKTQIEGKLRALKAKMIRDLERGRYFGLDHQVRTIQKNYRWLARI